MMFSSVIILIYLYSSELQNALPYSAMYLFACKSAMLYSSAVVKCYCLNYAGMVLSCMVLSSFSCKGY